MVLYPNRNKLMSSLRPVDHGPGEGERLRHALWSGLQVGAAAAVGNSIGDGGAAGSSSALKMRLRGLVGSPAGACCCSLWWWMHAPRLPSAPVSTW